MYKPHFVLALALFEHTSLRFPAFSEASTTRTRPRILEPSYSLWVEVPIHKISISHRLRVRYTLTVDVAYVCAELEREAGDGAFSVGIQEAVVETGHDAAGQ